MLLCDGNTSREDNGGELVNLYCTSASSYGLSSIFWPSKKCELSSFPMRGFTSLSSLLTSSLQAHLLHEQTFFPGSFYMSDEKLQLKSIWLLKTTYSPNGTCIGFSILLWKRRHLHIHNLRLDSLQISHYVICISSRPLCALATTNRQPFHLHSLLYHLTLDT